MKQKIEITFKEEETISIITRRVFKIFCGRCETQVEMLPLEAAALILGLSEAQIFELIKADKIHLVGSEPDYICRNSLENFNNQF